MLFMFSSSASPGITAHARITKQDFIFSRQRNILLFIFTSLWVTAVKSEDFLNLECKAKNVGHYGQQSLLECVIQTSKDVQDPSILVVSWKKLSSMTDGNGQFMLVYDRGELNQNSGYRFAEPSWNEKNMNVSLLITNTAVTDEGLHSCLVITDSGHDIRFITLEVRAKYSAPTVRSVPEKTVLNTDRTLICESDGGYPKGELRWFDEQNNDWTKSSKMEVKQTPSGLFQLTSTLELLEGSTFSKYTCVVFDASGVKEDEVTFEMPNPPPLPPSGKPVEISKMGVALLVIGSLIVGLLCVLLLYQRRSLRGTTCRMNK